MSTSYYRLKNPFTHLRLESTGEHDHLTVWIDHGNAGTLVVPCLHTRAFVESFFDRDDYRPVLRTHWGGKERGAVVTVNDESLPDEAMVVSEYGELLTVGEVKARDGAKRADNWPTELFGYEKANS